MANPVTGAPIYTLYDTGVNFGKSNIKFTNNILIDFAWFFLDLLRDPVLWVIEWYIEPIS
jgi:hypothetical protein